MIMIRVFIALCLLLNIWLISSCDNSGDEFVDADELAKEQDAQIAAFLNENAIQFEKDNSGIYYSIVKANPEGASASGKIVSIYYTAKTLEGEIFDDHLEEDGEPAIMKQGADAIIPTGLDTGLGYMREGETFTFYIPSRYAYGFFSFSSAIPANAIIEMQVTVVSLQGISERTSQEIQMIDDYIASKSLDSVQVLNSGLRYKRLSQGSGSSANKGQMVTVTYKGMFLDDKIFDQTTGNQDFRFELGAGRVIAGFDEGVAAMKMGERALIIIPSILGYQESVRVIPELFKSKFIANNIIPPYSTIDPYEVLVFEITLKSVN